MEGKGAEVRKERPLLKDFQETGEEIRVPQQGKEKRSSRGM